MKSDGFEIDDRNSGGIYVRYPVVRTLAAFLSMACFVFFVGSGAGNGNGFFKATFISIFVAILGLIAINTVAFLVANLWRKTVAKDLWRSYIEVANFLYLFPLSIGCAFFIGAIAIAIVKIVRLA